MSAALAGGGPVRLGRPAVVAIAVVATAASGAGGVLAVLAGPRLLLAALALALVGVVAAAPRFGAYTWLAVCPLVVGIARGDFLGVLRPNEALLLAIAAGVALHVAWQRGQGQALALQPNGIDAAMALLVLAGGLVPLLLRHGRSGALAGEDVLYAMVFVKYGLLYAVFRLSVVRPADVGAALVISLAAAVVVALVGFAQVAGLFGVRALLSQYLDSPFAGFSGVVGTRASSTVASSFGLASIMALSLAIVLATSARTPRRWLPLGGLALLFGLGIVSAGQISGVIGGIVAVVTVCLLAGQQRRMLLLLPPVAILAALVLWPVLAARLVEFAGPAGLPPSWAGRLDNLQRFVLPELLAGSHPWLGVRPAARIAAPEAWRDWVYIESGYLWLLWCGGVPLLLAFVLLVTRAWRELARRARDRADAVGIAATAGCAGIASLVVLMLFDPHLTMRGGADLFFPLLALGAAGPIALEGSSRRGRAWR